LQAIRVRAELGQQLGHFHEWNFKYHCHGLIVKIEPSSPASTSAIVQDRLGLTLSFARVLSFQLKKSFGDHWFGVYDVFGKFRFQKSVGGLSL
jgi:hypothetical protein